jgi:hypothetical protein
VVTCARLSHIPMGVPDGDPSREAKGSYSNRVSNLHRSIRVAAMSVLVSGVGTQARRVDHDLARLSRSQASSNGIVEIDDEHLDLPRAESLSKPARTGYAGRRVRVAECDDELARGSSAAQRDELQGVLGDLVELRSLEPALVSKDLDKDRLVRRDAVDIDAGSTVQAQRSWGQLDANRGGHATTDYCLSASLLMRVALMSHQQTVPAVHWRVTVEQ